MTAIKSDNRILALLAAGVLFTAGCSGGSGSVEVASSPAPDPSATTVNPSDLPDQQAPPDRLTMEVTIERGQVTPTNASLETTVNTTIVVKVKSDAPDELHVHSTPEHTFKVEPNKAQQFQFSVEVPGSVDIELHQLNKVVATVQVKP